jgi:hypothetical protein
MAEAIDSARRVVPDMDSDAGNAVDQNRLNPCRERPFGLEGELKSERENGNPR